MLASGVTGSKRMSLKMSSSASKPSVQVGLVSSRFWLKTAHWIPRPRYSRPLRVGLLKTVDDVPDVDW